MNYSRILLSAFLLSAFLLSACAVPVTKNTDTPTGKSSAIASTNPMQASTCLGTVALPPEMKDLFEPVEDKTLLSLALGQPEKGGLCQGKVYQAKTTIDLTLFRSWNSTNTGSRIGKWWSLNKPTGEVSKYRHNYEICYQWSPLDKLTQCKLKAGAVIVLGTGQSAFCSDYLSYPVSGVQQIYIDDPASVAICHDSNANFLWQASGEQ